VEAAAVELVLVVLLVRALMEWLIQAAEPVALLKLQHPEALD
jgi:hypothetical protein